MADLPVKNIHDEVGASEIYLRSTRPLSPTAEAVDLKSIQCRFESDRGHSLKKGEMMQAQRMMGRFLIRDTELFPIARARNTVVADDLIKTILDMVQTANAADVEIDWSTFKTAYEDLLVGGSILIQVDVRA